MLVKVAKLGSEVTEVLLNDGATVSEALAAARISVGNEEIRLNGESAAMDDDVKNGDLVTVVPAVKGGA
jgi:sulfur carrier protein ThiS